MIGLGIRWVCFECLPDTFSYGVCWTSLLTCISLSFLTLEMKVVLFANKVVG